MNPILKDFPDDLETDRLLLRCPSPGDGAELFQAVLESVDSLRQWPAYLPWARREPSVAASEAYCRESYVKFVSRLALPMLIFHKGSGSLIGAIGLQNIDWDVPKFGLGFWCRSSQQGNGYVSEAVIGLSDWAFRVLGARRVQALIDEHNQRGRKVLLRTGFTMEGILRNDRVNPGGRLSNTVVYSRLPERRK